MYKELLEFALLFVFCFKSLIEIDLLLLAFIVDLLLLFMDDIHVL